MFVNVYVMHQENKKKIITFYSAFGPSSDV